jgi:hypothetical protein
LQDIREILGDREWITSNSLITRLRGREWTITNGKRLANMLKPYLIEPTQQRRGGDPERGYFAKAFADAFARYLRVPDVPDVPPPMEGKEENLPDPEIPAVTSGTSGTASIFKLRRF